MSIETNLNTSPYFDDYDENKDFYKILFRPGVALQARELTQLQDMFQTQIERFGDHIFKSGTIISGVNFQFNRGLDYVKILDQETNGAPVVPSAYKNLFVKNSSNLVAEVVEIKTGFESRDPEMNYLYLNYINSGDGGNTSTFATDDVLTVYSEDYKLFGFNIVNGGTGVSNTDSVVITSALLVNNSTIAAGDTITQTIGSNTANVYVIESNNTFGKIFLNNEFYSNTDGYVILKIRPNIVDLANSSLTGDAWTILPNYNVVQGANSASVVGLIGTNARALLTTDGSGIINDVSLIAQGAGYEVLPHVSIRSTSGVISSIDIRAENYKAQVTVASNTFTGGNSTPVGKAYMFGVSDGVIYQKGMFLRVDNQRVVVNAYSSNVHNMSVGFVSTETLVNNNIDETLLDPATGTPNFAAPGAHRLKITPSLEVIASSNVASNNTFFPLVDFREGEPYRQYKTTLYGELSKEFERRTKETNGSFVIDPFQISTKDKSPYSNTHFNVVVDPGLIYLDGKRIATERNTNVSVRRSTDTKALTNQSLGISYGSYALMRELVGYFDFRAGSTVNIYDEPQKFISLQAETFTPISSYSPSGNIVGTARIRSLEYDSGTPGDPFCIYRMYLFDVQMYQGKSFEQHAKSFYYDGAEKGIADIQLVTSPTTGLDIAKIYVPELSSLVIPIGNRATRAVNTVTYSYRTTGTANISTTGVLSLTISDDFPYGNNASLSATQRRQLMLLPTVNAISTNTVSNVTATVYSNTVTGTSLTSKFEVGDFVYIEDQSNTSANSYTKIISIANNSTMTIADPWWNLTSANVQVARFFPEGAPIALESTRVSANLNGSSKTLTINISNTAGEVRFSAQVPAIVVYNAEKKNAQELTKTIKRGIKVKLKLANNAGGLNGPWCLGIPDVFRLNNVYVANVSSVNTNSSDISRFFYVDNGQNRDYYDHSKLVCFDSTFAGLNANTWLLIDVDCFGLSTPTDAGFFTYESYTVASNNASRAELGNTAVHGLEIPDFQDTDGALYDLIDCIDFRPRVIATANITSSEGSASINPANTVDLGAHDKLFPLVDSVFKFDTEFYLRRKDRVIIDDESNIRVLEGKPGVQGELPPDPLPGTMTLGILNIPPYPTAPVVPDPNLVFLGAKKTGGPGGPIYTKVYNYRVTEDENPAKKTLQPRRYTMADIGKLERRIEDLEYYTNLTQLEKKISDLNIPSEVDSSKNRFKNGFFVEGFNNYVQAQSGDPEFKCIIAQNLSYLMPPMAGYNLQAMFNYSNTTTRSSLRSEDDLLEPGVNKFGESVLLLPPDGIEVVLDQDKATGLITGAGGNYTFVGDLSIRPANMRVLIKGELVLTGEAAGPIPRPPAPPPPPPPPPAPPPYVPPPPPPPAPPPYIPPPAPRPPVPSAPPAPPPPVPPPPVPPPPVRPPPPPVRPPPPPSPPINYNANGWGNKFTSRAPPPPAKIICSYMGQEGRLDSVLTEADQKFGVLLAKHQPVLYRGYIYWARYIVDVLKGETDVGFIGLNLVPSAEVRRKVNHKLSNFLFNISVAGFKDWAEYMAYRVGTLKDANYSGAVIFYVLGALCVATGLFIKDPKTPHTVTKATLGLTATLLTTVLTYTVSPINKVYSKVRDFFRKGNK